MQHFGKRLRRARKAAGHNTIAAGAEHLGIPARSLCDYEAEERVPGGVALQIIGKRFAVDLNWLLGNVTAPSGGQ